jgi:hypothetical protein
MEQILKRIWGYYIMELHRQKNVTVDCVSEMGDEEGNKKSV